MCFHSGGIINDSRANPLAQCYCSSCVCVHGVCLCEFTDISYIYVKVLGGV